MSNLRQKEKRGTLARREKIAPVSRQQREQKI
jgi:hypothetical protein